MVQSPYRHQEGFLRTRSWLFHRLIDYVSCLGRPECGVMSVVTGCPSNGTMAEHHGPRGYNDVFRHRRKLAMSAGGATATSPTWTRNGYGQKAASEPLLEGPSSMDVPRPSGEILLDSFDSIRPRQLLGSVRPSMLVAELGAENSFESILASPSQRKQVDFFPPWRRREMASIKGIDQQDKPPIASQVLFSRVAHCASWAPNCASFSNTSTTG